MDNPDKLLSTKEATELLGLSESALGMRRRHARENGLPPYPPYLIVNNRVMYRLEDILKAKSVVRPRRPLKPKKPPVAYLSQKQTMALLDLSKGMLDHDFRHKRSIPVWGSSSNPRYPLGGIKEYLANKPDRLLTVHQTILALNTTHQRLLDDQYNHENFGSVLLLPYEKDGSEVVYRLSKVLAVLTHLAGELQ